MAEIIQYEEEYQDSTKRFILSILSGEFGWGDTKRPGLDDIGGFYQGSKSEFWIAVDNGEVVGSIAIKDYGGGRGYLKRMYVEKGLRGSGLARRLLDTALDYARDKGYMEIFIGTVKEMGAANKFYSKNGFEKIDKLPDDLPEFGDDVFYKMAL